MRKTNVLLYGEGGTGKSGSIATIFKLLDKEPNLKVRFLSTESNALEGLSEGLERHKIKLKEGNLAYMVCRPDVKTALSMKEQARNYKDNFLDVSERDALKVKISTGDRSKSKTFLSILYGTADFKGTDYVTKETKSYGDILTWDETHILVVDSLSACCEYLMADIVAIRSATIMSDFKDGQHNLKNKLILPLTEQTSCSIIMLGHPILSIDPNVKQPKEDENKIKKIYPRTIGTQLNGYIESRFTETIYSYIDHLDNFYWAGKKQGVSTSPRKIPREDKLKQDFSLYGLFGID